MSETEAIIAEIINGGVNGTQDPSVAAKPVTNEIAVGEPAPPRDAPQPPKVSKYKTVDGKEPVDTSDMEALFAVTVYPKGYIKFQLSKYQNMALYIEDYQRLVAFCRSPQADELLERAKSKGLTNRPAKD